MSLTLLTKLETNSKRVKGLDFHPKRPWVLASLHNGLIQLWDYRIRTLLDKFDEHDGPVRGISFHPTQPLFVSGGDDYKIKVWNYKLRRCLFTLLGHLDYIRTVKFHHEYPWILSASDDQTIRIWNWQSRQCIAVLTGHNHYVMCASFHPAFNPKEDLVVSASLDQTVRIWDLTGLRKKTVSSGSFDASMAQTDLFGNPNVVVKYVLEGHDRGVNWASFHPTLPLIISGADDRYVKLWRMNETKAWEVDTLRGHMNNVSCVIFHPRQELILSNSEDKTIRVWDMAKRTGIQTFRREHDRFWIMAAHPEKNLFAAGHDSGLIVFKLERERPAYAVFKDTLFYVKERYLRAYDIPNNRDVPVMSIRRSIAKNPRSLSYNPAEKAVLLCSEAEGGTYEYYKIPNDSRSGDSVESIRGLSSSAVFVKSNRFAVLETKTQTILVKDLKNETINKITAPAPTDMLFPAGLTCVLLRSEDKIILYDLQQKRSIAEISAPNIKYVFWSEKHGHVALLGKETLIIATKKLEQLCCIHETIRLKSAAWDDNGVLLYTTLSHLKYCLLSGDHGIIRTLDAPVYLTAVRGNKVYCLDREIKNKEITIDPTEYMFKMALQQNRYSDVLKMVKPGHTNLVGQSIIAYLQAKGYPEFALYFVKDERTKFNLALECGNIEVAQACAKTLDDKDCWHRLGVEALRQGNHQVVEMAYQRTKNFDRLSFLYLITGNSEKLTKMLRIAEYRNDIMGRFHNALYLGNVAERVKILEEVGQLPLAYVTAATHGLTEEAEALKARLDGNVPPLPKEPTLMMPPTPVMRLHETNWPLLNISTRPTLTTDSGKFSTGDEDEDAGGGAGWPGDDDVTSPVAPGDDPFAPSDEEVPGGGWGGDKDPIGSDDDMGAGWNDEPLDILDVPSVKTTDNYFVAPRPGADTDSIWCANSKFAADHAAAGSFESAMELLNQQAGIVEFAPLKPFFLSLWMGSRTSQVAVVGAPPLLSGLHRNTELAAQGKGLPALCVNLQSLIERLKVAYKATTGGKFEEAIEQFLYIMHALLFVVVDNRQAKNEVQELLELCREYVTGLRMDLHRKNLNSQPVLQLQLAAYFTHCKLQPIHRMLSLRSAMKAAYRLKNFATAGAFARRLLELSPKADIASEARKVAKFAEQNAQDENRLDYDERNPFVVCGISFSPIYKNKPSVLCPYCSSSFLPSHKGKLCPTCQIAQIGKEVSGWRVMPGKD